MPKIISFLIYYKQLKYNQETWMLITNSEAAGPVSQREPPERLGAAGARGWQLGPRRVERLVSSTLAFISASLVSLTSMECLDEIIYQMEANSRRSVREVVGVCLPEDARSRSEIKARASGTSPSTTNALRKPAEISTPSRSPIWPPRRLKTMLFQALPLIVLLSLATQLPQAGCVVAQNLMFHNEMYFGKDQECTIEIQSFDYNLHDTIPLMVMGGFTDSIEFLSNTPGLGCITDANLMHTFILLYEQQTVISPYYQTKWKFNLPNNFKEIPTVKFASMLLTSQTQKYNFKIAGMASYFTTVGQLMTQSATKNMLFLLNTVFEDFEEAFEMQTYTVAKADHFQFFTLSENTFSSNTDPFYCAYLQNTDSNPKFEAFYLKFGENVMNKGESIPGLVQSVYGLSSILAIQYQNGLGNSYEAIILGGSIVDFSSKSKPIIMATSYDDPELLWSYSANLPLTMQDFHYETELLSYDSELRVLYGVAFAQSMTRDLIQQNSQSQTLIFIMRPSVSEIFCQRNSLLVTFQILDGAFVRPYQSLFRNSKYLDMVLVVSSAVDNSRSIGINQQYITVISLNTLQECDPIDSKAQLSDGSTISISQQDIPTIGEVRYYGRICFNAVNYNYRCNLKQVIWHGIQKGTFSYLVSTSKSYGSADGSTNNDRVTTNFPGDSYEASLFHSQDKPYSIIQSTVVSDTSVINNNSPDVRAIVLNSQIEPMVDVGAPAFDTKSCTMRYSNSCDRTNVSPGTYSQYQNTYIQVEEFTMTGLLVVELLPTIVSLTCQAPSCPIQPWIRYKFSSASTYYQDPLTAGPTWFGKYAFQNIDTKQIKILIDPSLNREYLFSFVGIYLDYKTGINNSHKKFLITKGIYPKRYSPSNLQYSPDDSANIEGRLTKYYTGDSSCSVYSKTTVKKFDLPSCPIAVCAATPLTSETNNYIVVQPEPIKIYVTKEEIAATKTLTFASIWLAFDVSYLVQAVYKEYSSSFRSVAINELQVDDVKKSLVIESGHPFTEGTSTTYYILIVRNCLFVNSAVRTFDYSLVEKGVDFGYLPITIITTANPPVTQPVQPVTDNGTGDNGGTVQPDTDTDNSTGDTGSTVQPDTDTGGTIQPDTDTGGTVQPDTGGTVQPDTSDTVQPDTGGTVQPDTGGTVQPNPDPDPVQPDEQVNISPSCTAQTITVRDSSYYLKSLTNDPGMNVVILSKTEMANFFDVSDSVNCPITGYSIQTNEGSDITSNNLEYIRFNLGTRGLNDDLTLTTGDTNVLEVFFLQIKPRGNSEIQTIEAKKIRVLIRRNYQDIQEAYAKLDRYPFPMFTKMRQEPLEFQLPSTLRLIYTNQATLSMQVKYRGARIHSQTPTLMSTELGKKNLESNAYGISQIVAIENNVVTSPAVTADFIGQYIILVETEWTMDSEVVILPFLVKIAITECQVSSFSLQDMVVHSSISSQEIRERQVYKYTIKGPDFHLEFQADLVQSPACGFAFEQQVYINDTLAQDSNYPPFSVLSGAINVQTADNALAQNYDVVIAYKLGQFTVKAFDFILQVATENPYPPAFYDFAEYDHLELEEGMKISIQLPEIEFFKNRDSLSIEFRFIGNSPDSKDIFVDQDLQVLTIQFTKSAPGDYSGSLILREGATGLFTSYPLDFTFKDLTLEEELHEQIEEAIEEHADIEQVEELIEEIIEEKTSELDNEEAEELIEELVDYLEPKNDPKKPYHGFDPNVAGHSEFREWQKMIFEGEGLEEEEESDIDFKMPKFEPVELKIEVTRDGLCKIKSNVDLKIPKGAKSRRNLQEGFNIRNVLDIKVEDQEGNQVEVDYTFDLIEWTKRQVIVDVDFDQPLMISQGYQKDLMHLKIKQPEMFISAQSGESLQKDRGFDYKKTVPKQLPKGIKEEVLQEAAQAQTETLGGFMVVHLIISVALKGSMDKLWVMVSALQFIVYLPVMKVGIPANLDIFLENLRKIAEFKVIEPKEIIKYVLGYLEFQTESQDELVAQSEFESAGFKSFSYFDNLQFFIFIMVAFFFGLIVMLMVAIIQRYRTQILERIKVIVRKMFWCNIIRSLNMAYLKSFIAFAIAVRVLEFDRNDFPKNLTSSIVIINGVIFVLFPIWTLYFLASRYEVLDEPEVRVKFETLYEGLNFKRRETHFYPLIYLSRRALFTLIAIFLGSYSYFQVMSVNFMNFLYTIYIGNTHPNKTKKVQMMEMFNEWVIQILCFHLMLFTDFINVSNESYAYELAFSFQYMCYTLIGVNVLALLTDFYRPIQIAYLKFKGKREVKKKMQEWFKKKEYLKKSASQRRIERIVRNKEFAAHLENDFYQIFPKNPNFVHPNDLIERAQKYPAAQSSTLFNFNPTVFMHNQTRDAMNIMKQEMISRYTAEQQRLKNQSTFQLGTRLNLGLIEEVEEKPIQAKVKVPHLFKKNMQPSMKYIREGETGMRKISEVQSNSSSSSLNSSKSDAGFAPEATAKKVNNVSLEEDVFYIPHKFNQ